MILTILLNLLKFLLICGFIATSLGLLLGLAYKYVHHRGTEDALKQQIQLTLDSTGAKNWTLQAGPERGVYGFVQNGSLLMTGSLSELLFCLQQYTQEYPRHERV